MNKSPVLKHCKKKSKKPLEIVHIDTKTVQTPSKQGSRYFMILVDDYTRKKFEYPEEHRDEQLECFQKFKAEAERKFPNYKVKTLRSIKTDGTWEFISEKFRSYLHQSGITHKQRAADSNRGPLRTEPAGASSTESKKETGVSKTARNKEGFRYFLSTERIKTTELLKAVVTFAAR
jgi:hypothetical protein